MNILGTKFKEVRKEKKLSQTELCKGICTQATVSNIESKGVCDSLDIFSKLCIRLGSDVQSFLIPSDEEQLIKILDMVEEHCLSFEYKSAFNLLSEDSINASEVNPFLYSKYNYYMGLVYLLWLDNQDEAFFYLYKGTEFVDTPSVYTLLSFDALGAFYNEKGDTAKAKTFHDKAIQLIEKHKIDLPSIGYKIFYNTARFYSTVKEHKKSVEFCIKGINLNKKYHTTYCLDQLYYELGYNKYCLNEPCEQEYLLAYALAVHGKNKKLQKMISNKNKKYQLSLSFL